MTAPSGIWTFLSMIALRTTACRPTSTLCISTLLSTSANEWTATPGDTIDWRTTLPEITVPAQMIELMATPVRPGSSSTNFAGGSGSA